MKKVFPIQTIQTFCVLLIFLNASLGLAQERKTEGTVFEDRNNNAIQDNGEPGIAGVMVSDQSGTAVTGSDGRYVLMDTSNSPFIFISTPEGYSGKFFSDRAPKRSFPLKKTGIRNHFKFIHASDTHVDSANLPRMKRFRELADSTGAEFILLTGDLIRDALRNPEALSSAYYEMFLKEISKFKIPVYSVPGNHELFGIERDKSLVSAEHPLYGKKMYRHFLGPDYYSFNYGGIHFVGMNTVDFQNLYYYGGVDSLQLKWLKGDLAAIDPQKPVITFNHIPFLSPGFSFMDFEDDIFYGPQLLRQEDTLRHRHIVYNFGKVKKIIGDRPFPLALSGHYHAAQVATMSGSPTIFSQTSAITRPDNFDSHGFLARSGFTLYEITDKKITASTFIPLNLP